MKPTSTPKTDTTVTKKDTATIFTGALGTPLVCGVVNGPVCIWNGQARVFGELPIKYVANDTSGSPALQLAKTSGKLFTALPAVTGADTTINLGLETVKVHVDTVSTDSGAQYAKVTVTKVCDGVEMCAPSLWLDCSSGGAMTSPCLPLGTIYSFGEYAIRLDAIDLSTPTKLKVVISALRYDCKVAKTDTIAELTTDTINIGTRTIYVTANDIHVTILPDSTGDTAVTPLALSKRFDGINSCAVLTVSDCQK